MSDVQDQLQDLLAASRRVIRAASLALPDAVQALAAVVEEIDQADETPLNLVAGLVEWAGQMGGWEAPIWRRAEAMLVRHGRRDPEPAEDAGSCEHCPADGGPCNVCSPPTPAGWGPLLT